MQSEEFDHLIISDKKIISSLHLVDHSWLQVDEDGTGNVLTRTWKRSLGFSQVLSLISVLTSLGKEGVERVVGDADGFVGGHLPVRLDPVLQAIELPASVAHLATGLAHVDGDAFPLRRHFH